MNGPSTAPILTSLRLLKALDLARRGKIKAAQAVLENEGAPPENPVELHALAALVTREGDYLRALRLWRLLLEREPGHYEAKRMIASIELWISRPAWVRLVPAGAVALAVVIALVAWALSTSSPPRPARNVPSPPPAPASVSPARSRPVSPPPPIITVPDRSKRQPGR